VVAASALAGVASIGATADDTPTPAVTVTGNVALVSDYRFRGFSQNNGNPAIQGGFDLNTASGFHIGTWASSIGFTSGGIETDAYADYGWTLAGLKWDVGLYGYIYSDADFWNFYEVTGNVSKSFGPLSTTVGFNYAPSQDNLRNSYAIHGDSDNIYVYGKGSLPIGKSPFALAGSLGYSSGALDFSSSGDGTFDWSLGGTATVMGLTFGLTYVDTSSRIHGLSTATAVFSVSKTL
jgi:uncharacterized protein (TIGR02001 family)